ncbi:MAG TPA: stimulus-sensing domain-containing protein [Acetobacteraceae bacterium]|nr:stimulus-sensing domain-containing protein [Acetobacteraceae bacterium]
MSLHAGALLPRQRWISPLLRRILLVNALPLLLLVVALLYLDQYQNGLLEAEVSALREQARIFGGALAESAVSLSDPQNPKLVPDIARPLLYRLTEPTPDADAKLYAPDGSLIADSRIRATPKGEQRTPLPPPQDLGPLGSALSWISDRLVSILPQRQAVSLDLSPGGAGPEWAPDVKEVIRLSSNDQSHEMPPFIRRTVENQLLVTVSEPVERDGHTVGIILLTREAREVDASLASIRISILGLFVLALVLTVLLSFYLSRTIARPILQLATAAAEMREGQGRTGSVPRALMARRDEVGTLAVALADSAAALWHRMDAIERFAADVAHEIKNPLSSIRSAIETLRRIDDPNRQRQLLAIIADDVTRLNRLISDVSDASRVDAELSRLMAERVDLVPILATLKELQEATRGEADPYIKLRLPDHPLFVRGVEDRLVQVFRNLISNAESFSPASGRITITAEEKSGMVEVVVDDQGPGIPDGKLEQVFDRFYSERPKDERFGQHSGLGLSISRQIVEALRGRITAENRRTADGTVLGARFTVRLPAA